MEQETDEPAEEAEGLLALLARVPDPCSRHGRRYPLGALLGIAVAAVLSGARTYLAVAEFAAELSDEQLATLGCVRRPWEVEVTAPAEPTIRRALQRLDAEALDALVGGWLAEQLPDDHSAVAVDGKSLRGSVDPGGQRVHLLAALSHGRGTVLAQRQVGAKASEIEAFAPLLDRVALAGRTVTADTLHTQHDHARYLVERRQAAYLLAVKGNQPNLVTAISQVPQQAFSPSAPEC